MIGSFLPGALFNIEKFGQMIIWMSKLPNKIKYTNGPYSGFISRHRTVTLKIILQLKTKISI